MTNYKPRVRGSFSDRNGIEKINTIIQKDNLDERTRNAIVNIFDEMADDCSSKEFYNYIFKHIFLVTSDDIPEYNSEKREIVVEGIKYNWSYHEIFSFLEELLKYYVDETKNI